MSEREDHVLEVLSSQMPTVGMVQYGPDGTTPLNVVRFYVCPLDGDTIPVPFDDHPEWDFPQWHLDHHLQIARMQDDLDSLREDIRGLRQLIDSKEPM